MSTYTDANTLTDKLNDLLEKTYDAEKGYKKAAENADSSNLQAYFERKSKERNEFGHKIKAEIQTFGNDVDKGGSATGAMHRTWMDVKAFFSADSDESMLEEAIRGEKASVEEYKEVLKDTALPPSTSTVLTQQMNQISTDLSNIKSLEDLK
ncbi:PA2169 family four-helix-bundle protein [Allomuricauda sp. d1]|uniref:ferritin-like domain-containing protein n=1 Tax=Allomuricauda sp. d1 TaxID=3136725 RepID=UPI0031DCA482